MTSYYTGTVDATRSKLKSTWESKPLYYFMEVKKYAIGAVLALRGFLGKNMETGIPPRKGITTLMRDDEPHD